MYFFFVFAFIYIHVFLYDDVKHICVFFLNNCPHGLDREFDPLTVSLAYAYIKEILNSFIRFNLKFKKKSSAKFEIKNMNFF